MNTRIKGYSAEDTAIEYLISSGYTVISRNYQCRTGEIDCIAKDPCGDLVFFEIKSSNTASKGHPFYWVTKAKQKKIITCARLYLAEHSFTQQPCRFDVIAIVNGTIDHLRNAFIT